MAEMRLSMTGQQRALADRLAPHFGFRSGVALVFALMANQIDADELARVAGIVGADHIAALGTAARALTTGDDGHDYT